MEMRIIHRNLEVKSMGMTDEERFHFDVAGFFVRPAILTPDEVAEIVDQIDRIRHRPESLPPEHRAVPGGPSSLLIDHPKVIDVLREIIAPGDNIRLESSHYTWRNKGESAGAFHGGGPKQTNPIFGYRVHDGQIYAGMVRVIFELTDVAKGDGGTCFIAGSHKANFPMHPAHTSWEEGKRSDLFVTYSCPKGSALFFTENVCHAGPEWKRDTPRIAVLNAYSHIGTHWHRLTVPPEVLAALPREKQAFFREPWMADFVTLPPKKNTIERFVSTGEAPINTEWVVRAREAGGRK
jgi:hypothetical protein